MTVSAYSRRRCQHPPLMYYAFCFVELLSSQQRRRRRRTEHAIRGQTASHLHSAEWRRKARGNETSYQYFPEGVRRGGRWLQTSQSSRCTWAELVSLSPTVCGHINLSRPELSFYLRASGRPEDGGIYSRRCVTAFPGCVRWVGGWVLVMNH